MVTVYGLRMQGYAVRPGAILGLPSRGIRTLAARRQVRYSWCRKWDVCACVARGAQPTWGRRTAQGFESPGGLPGVLKGVSPARRLGLEKGEQCDGPGTCICKYTLATRSASGLVLWPNGYERMAMDAGVRCAPAIESGPA